VNDIPEWAKKRAVSMANAEAGFNAWDSAENSFSMRAFARYIAEHEEHEELPVDPLYEALKSVVELGRYDTREQTELLRGELKSRGLKIVEANPQP